MDCEKQISELESLLNSKVYTIEDRTELEEVIPSAKEICRFYDPAPSFTSDLKAKLESTWEKCDTLLYELQEAMPCRYRDSEDKCKALRKRLSGDHTRILYCLDNLGLICAYEAVNICRENSPTVTEEGELYRKSYLQCEYYFEEVLSIFKTSLPNGCQSLLDTACDCPKFVAMGYISPQLSELIQICLSFGESTQVLCLIFVERIIAAKVIERFVKQVSYLSHFTVSYLTGSKSSADSLAPKVHTETLESFRSGKVNLLFATDVVEEGIDVPNCSSVIRFDLPKTVRSYIQSRGLARQSESQFIMMIERGNNKQRDQIFDLIRREYSNIDAAINRDPDAAILRTSTVTDTGSYFVDATGASVTADACVNLIHRYCEKLPRDKYFNPKPDFHFLSSGGLYQCRLTLPASAAFQTLVGPPRRNTNLAKQHVCFEACKILHQMGALNDHLFPFKEDPSQNICASLIESCDRFGYSVKDTCVKQGDIMHAVLRLQLEDVLLIAEGVGHNEKVAKGRAAVYLWKELENRGTFSSSRKKRGPDGISQINSDPPEPVAQKRQKIDMMTHSEQNRSCSDSKDSWRISSDSKSVPVLGSISMRKGGPRTALLELCRRLHWPLSGYKSTEHKSRTPIEFADGPETRTAFNSFVSTVTLTIPDFGVIEQTGDPRADKKSSFDSAAVHMLHELERRGKLKIGGGV